MWPPLRRRSWQAPWRSRVPYRLCSTLPPAHRIPLLSCACWMWTPGGNSGSYPGRAQGQVPPELCPAGAPHPGQIERYKLRLDDAANTFLAGHRIRFPSPLPPTDISLRITTLERTREGYRVSNGAQRIYWGGPYGSRLELRLVPQGQNRA